MRLAVISLTARFSLSGSQHMRPPVSLRASFAKWDSNIGRHAHAFKQTPIETTDRARRLNEKSMLRTHKDRRQRGSIFGMSSFAPRSGQPGLRVMLVFELLDQEVDEGAHRGRHPCHDTNTADNCGAGKV